MAIKVNITEQENIYIERLWYEYKSALSILHYLMSQQDTLEQHIQLYADSCEAKCTTLELAKQDMFNKYKPNDNKNLTQFDFDFENCTMNFYTVEEEETKQ